MLKSNNLMYITFHKRNIAYIKTINFCVYFLSEGFEVTKLLFLIFLFLKCLSWWVHSTSIYNQCSSVSCMVKCTVLFFLFRFKLSWKDFQSILPFWLWQWVVKMWYVNRKAFFSSGGLGTATFSQVCSLPVFPMVSGAGGGVKLPGAMCFYLEI